MLAQEFAYSHAVSYHTPYTKYAQDAASNIVSYNITYIVLSTGDIIVMQVCNAIRIATNKPSETLNSLTELTH